VLLPPSDALQSDELPKVSMKQQSSNQSTNTSAKKRKLAVECYTTAGSDVNSIDYSVTAML
jgi:hypothetical protein